MMRDDAKRCCLLSLLILSASLLVFLLCVRGCQVHGAPQADPVECFYFCGRGIGKMRPAVWNEKYSIYVCHCESWHTCWAHYHWSAGWAGERFSAQRPRDLGYLGMIWPFWDDSGRLGVCRVFQISWLATTLQDSSSVTFCRGIGVHPLIALCGTEDNGSSPILCRELWRTYSQNLVQSDHIYAGHLFFKLAVFKDSEA